MFLVEFEGYDLTKYNDFLIKCSKKDYVGQQIHSHHIIPRFMEGTNDKENLIRLNQQDHFDAHLILAFCFPNTIHYYHGNILSAHRLSIDIKIPDNFKELFSETQRMTGYGRKHTQKAKDKISKANKGRKKSPEAIAKQKESRKGFKHTEEEKQHLSKVLKEQYASGKRIVNFGDYNSIGRIEYRERNRERMKTEQNGKDNPSAKKIQHIESGKIFDCLKDAMIEFGFKNYNKIRSEIKKGNFIILGEYVSTEKMKENHCKSKQIIHVESGEVFRSLTQVNEKFNINFPVLYRLINRGIFKYLNPNDTNPPNTSINTRSKSVINNQTGQIYNSVKSLRDEFGFTQWELEKRIKRGEFTILKNQEIDICQN